MYTARLVSGVARGRDPKVKNNETPRELDGATLPAMPVQHRARAPAFAHSPDGRRVVASVHHAVAHLARALQTRL
eukprot:11669153-Heterocapsa_arctica.AAC.1